ncbi:MAG TPA: hypothetical protein VNT55_00935 [Baekduia sp.]|nr:hypothetical protein [Baekduia sp.]
MPSINQRMGPMMPRRDGWGDRYGRRMVDAKFPRPCSHVVRRWIATRQLADPTRIRCAAARRGWAGLITRRTITTTVDFASTV